jgi:hypothetical protein
MEFGDIDRSGGESGFSATGIFPILLESIHSGRFWDYRLLNHKVLCGKSDIQPEPTNVWLREFRTFHSAYGSCVLGIPL